MAKLYTVSHIVVVRDDEEAQSRNWVSDQTDYLIRDLGRGLWSVRVINEDDTLGPAEHIRTAELEKKYLHLPDTEVYAYKATREL